MRKQVSYCAALALAISLLPSFGSASLAASSAINATRAPILTPAIMDKMLKLIAEKGVDRDVTTAAQTLGFTAPGETWASRVVIWKENNGTVHSFYISRGADQDVGVSLTTPDKTVYGYRAHRDGTATAAFVWDAQTRQFTMRNPAAAQQSLDTELTFWAGLANEVATDKN